MKQTEQLSADFAPYLASAFYIDSADATVIAYTKKVIKAAHAVVAKEQIIALYYAIRDGFAYTPYKVVLKPYALKASHLLTKNDGYCIEKACLLAACARVIGVPSRLGFANVCNHVGSEKLETYLKTNVLVFHGYVDLFLEGKWVKATPAFNKELCEKQGVAPLDFNGMEDSIFQAYDANGQLFMEYLNDYGVFHDMPFDLFKRELFQHYGHIFDENNLDLSRWNL